MQVMVVANIGIKAFGTAVYFHQIHNADFSKSQHGAADGIIGDIGKFFFDGLKHSIHGGMFFGMVKLPINSHPLGRYFKVVHFALVNEIL